MDTDVVAFQQCSQLAQVAFVQRDIGLELIGFGRARIPVGGAPKVAEAITGAVRTSGRAGKLNVDLTGTLRINVQIRSSDIEHRLPGPKFEIDPPVGNFKGRKVI